MSAWRRIFTFTNALRVAITLVVVSAVALMVVVSGDHLVGQMHAARQVSSAQTGGSSIVPARTSAQEGFSLETLEDTLLGTYLRLNQERLETPAGTLQGDVAFTVEPGETAGTVADRLMETGIISDAQLFRLYMRYTGIDAELEAGQFTLSSEMSMLDIAQALQRALAEEIVVTIPEGLRAEEIADLLTAQGAVDGARFLELVRGGQSSGAALGSYSFLDDLPPGVSLEGFLFPDTYRLLVSSEAEDLLARMLDNFERQVVPAYRQVAAGLGRPLYDVIILASVVEREAVIREELPLIASVYLNRLGQGMLLRADPTVQYAMGFQPTSGQWWKTPVQLEEYAEVDSPYNTYLYGGLPPGPICSPGMGAIEASLHPSVSDFLYFVASGDGGHVFAETYEEHEANVERYMR